MISLRMERWQSSEAREEIHLFLAGTQTYVMGYNPQLVAEGDVLRMLALRGFALGSPGSSIEKERGAKWR